MRRETGKRGAASYLNRQRRDDVKNSVKNVLGGVFQWPPELFAPSVPTVATPVLTKIEETPVGPAELAVETFSVPTIAAPDTSVATFTDDGACTISIASPGVITLNSHGLSAGHEIYFKTSGTLPTGIVQYTHYYVKDPDTNTFKISATVGGANINTSGSQSGTHQLWTKD